jgi:hypothetical protein
MTSKKQLAKQELSNAHIDLFEAHSELVKTKRTLRNLTEGLSSEEARPIQETFAENISNLQKSYDYYDSYFRFRISMRNTRRTPLLNQLDEALISLTRFLCCHPKSRCKMVTLKTRLDAVVSAIHRSMEDKAAIPFLSVAVKNALKESISCNLHLRTERLSQDYKEKVSLLEIELRESKEMVETLKAESKRVREELEETQSSLKKARADLFLEDIRE